MDRRGIRGFVISNKKSKKKEVKKGLQVQLGALSQSPVSHAVKSRPPTKVTDSKPLQVRHPTVKVVINPKVFPQAEKKSVEKPNHLEAFESDSTKSTGKPLVKRSNITKNPTKSLEKSKPPTEKAGSFINEPVPQSIKNESAPISIIVLGHDTNHWQRCVSSIIEVTKEGEYELVFIDNRKNRYNIFTGYNYGISISTAPLVLFMHEDVKILDPQWLSKVRHIFRVNKKAGVVGVIGSQTLKKGLTWWDSDKVDRFGKLIHGKEAKENFVQLQKVPGNGKEVISLDGLWFVVSRECLSAIGEFDSTTYTGFHFYDIDTCVSARVKGYKVFLVDILVQHLYDGDWKKDESYFDARNRFWKKVKRSKDLLKVCNKLDIVKE